MTDTLGISTSEYAPSTAPSHIDPSTQAALLSPHSWLRARSASMVCWKLVHTRRMGEGTHNAAYRALLCRGVLDTHNAAHIGFQSIHPLPLPPPLLSPLTHHSSSSSSSSSAAAAAAAAFHNLPPCLSAITLASRLSVFRNSFSPDDDDCDPLSLLLPLFFSPHLSLSPPPPHSKCFPVSACFLPLPT